MLMLTVLTVHMCIYICPHKVYLLCIFSDKSAAEKRRQLIQESKFLGGDMEHTHLVKGLDFALLQKVSQQNRKNIVHTVFQVVSIDANQLAETVS